MNISVSTSIYHQPLREVQPGTRLDTLLCEYARAPFDRLWWWQALERHCGFSGTLHGARSEAGEALLALHEAAPGHLVALANWYTFRFRPIVRGDPALLELLAKALRSRGRRITLDKVPEEDGSSRALVLAFRAAGWWVFCEPCDTNHVLEVRGRDFTACRAALPGPLRTTLKRKSGKVRTQVLTHFDPEAWAQYESVYAQSWKGEEGAPAFLRAFAEAEGAAGRLRLGLAHDAADPTGPAIAAQMWSVEGNTAFIHKLAHRESARSLSPGSVLTAALLRHTLDTDQVALVDFGTGDDAYKCDWMNAVRPRYRVEAYRPGSLVNLPQLVRRLAARHLAAYLKRG
ncbi:GNAT family N-acetyltransferase [Novosphingobium sp. BW1]|uniref:GNAT family N-acetyltransferase n=1 Tax=Novosphingobium sp. BW1 TaxID=2592621 RepID=UPI0011DEE600|nr:GNAT family N-acetyltransferase [Novosphingobium sp. BW1]TYC90686.1 GNAT family N-acetyltransferase [Novosphingobium sp. BW1]